MSHWHVEAWIWIRDISVVLLYYFCSYGESCLLVSWCVGGRCDMVANDEDHGRSRRPSAEDQMWSSTGRYSMARRSGGWVMPCAVCTVHIEMRSTSFLVEPQNQGRVSWLSFKTKVDGFLIWASKLTALVWRFWPQNHRVSFLVYASKLSRLRFIGCTTKSTRGWFGAGHTSRSDGLLLL
jgi:hypothetical protein